MSVFGSLARLPGPNNELTLFLNQPQAPFEYPVEFSRQYREIYSEDRFDPLREPVRYRAEIEKAAVDLAPEPVMDAEGIPWSFEGMTEEDRRGTVAAYATSIAYVDSLVGRLMEEIELSGQPVNFS